MARYYRRGHWRTSRDGSLHWVSGHAVSRYGQQSSSPPLTLMRPVGPSFAAPYTRSSPQSVVEWQELPAEPNAHCPVCGAAVWFYRNRKGGCAYFDVLGRPWTLHPCMAMNRSGWDIEASTEAKARYIDTLRRRRTTGIDATSPKFARSESRQSPLWPSGRSGTAKPSRLILDEIPLSTDSLQRPATPVLWWLSVVASVAWVLGVAFTGHSFGGVQDANTLASWLWFAVIPIATSLRAIIWSFRAAERPQRIAPFPVALAMAAALPLFAGVTFANVASLGLGVPLAGLLWSQYVKGRARETKPHTRARPPGVTRPAPHPRAGSSAPGAGATPVPVSDGVPNSPVAREGGDRAHGAHQVPTAEHARMQEALNAYIRRRTEAEN